MPSNRWLRRAAAVLATVSALGCWNPSFGGLSAQNGCPEGTTAYQGVCVDQVGSADVGVAADASQSPVDAGLFDVGPLPPTGDIVSLSLSIWNTCFIKGGTAYCLGLSDNGQFGEAFANRQKIWSARALPLVDNTEPSRIAVGNTHSCVVSRRGRVFCSGQGAGANGTTVFSKVDRIDDAVGATAANAVTCIWKQNGKVRCWGTDTSGSLGNGRADIAADAPGSDVLIIGESPLTGITQVDHSGYHACALNGSSGEVWCWGHNESGQLGTGDQSSSAFAVRVANLGNGADAIAVGREHSCARVRNNTVKCWGQNNYGQSSASGTTILTTPEIRFSAVSFLGVGENYSCATETQAGISCVGLDNYGQVSGSGAANAEPQPAPALLQGLPDGTRFVAIEAGPYHACAVSAAQELWCWGYNDYGQTGEEPVSYSVPIKVGFE